MADIDGAEYRFKVILLGDKGVGKTSFIKKLIGNQSEPRKHETFEVNIYELFFQTQNESVHFSVWDPITEDELSDDFYVDVDGAVLMFDKTSVESYKNVSKWYDACQDAFDIPIVMLGNKQDDPERVIEPRMIKFHRYKSNIQYWDLSVKNSINIEKPFPWFMRKLLGYHNIKIIQQHEMKSETDHALGELSGGKTERHYEYKVILIGDNGVGKTSFISKFNCTEFEMKKHESLDVNIYPVLFKTQSETVRFNVWDSHSADVNLPDEFYKNASAAIMMFDVTNVQSYENISKWNVNCENFGHLPIVMLANKVDIARSEREVSPAMIQYQLRKANIQYWDLSVKDDYCVDKPFPWILTKLLGYGPYEMELIKKPQIAPGLGN